MPLDVSFLLLVWVRIILTDLKFRKIQIHNVKILKDSVLFTMHSSSYLEIEGFHLKGVSEEA